MKKLFFLSFLSCALIGCGDDTATTQTEQATTEQTQQSTDKEPQAKAVRPQDYFKDTQYSLNEKGTVIFGSAKELFEQNGDYNIEDKTLIIHSENPLKITLNVVTTKDESEELIKLDIANAFFYGIYQTFTHTNVPSIDLTVSAINQKQKPVYKNFTLKSKVTREYALNVLKNFSPAKSFDDLVNFDTSNEYNVVGYNSSKLYLDFRGERFRSQIIKSLTTGKLEQATEKVELSLPVTTDDFRSKLRLVDAQYKFSSRELNNGKKAYLFELSIPRIELVGQNQDDISSISIMTGFSNDNKVIFENLIALGAVSAFMPKPENMLHSLTEMIAEIAKKYNKNNKDVELVKLVDGITVKMSLSKSLGGIVFINFHKFETRPVVFN